MIIIFFSLIELINSEEIKIKVKIQNEIITNIDIENEKKYLIFLNPKLEELDNERFNKIAKDSLITEIVKKNELKKFVDINQEDEFINRIEINLLKQKNIKDRSEFIKILNGKNLEYKTIKKKLKIESLWNQLIYNKNINNVKINPKELKKKILKEIENNEKKFEYNLSEIVIM